MSYVLIATIGYILNATAILTDKVNVDVNIKSPAAYTFWIGLAGFATIILIPFGFNIPSPVALLYAFLSGATFMVALLFFYKSLHFDESSRVAPIVASVNAIFTLLAGALIFAQFLSRQQNLASAVMIVGLIIIATVHWSRHKNELHHLLFMIGAGCFFSLSSLFLKEVFFYTPFINGLIWSKIFSTVTVATFLLSPKIRAEVFASKVAKHHFVNKTSRLILVGQICGAIGGLLISYAIYLANPAIINAMQGVQYLFILLVVIALSLLKVSVGLDEQNSKKALIQKLIGAFFVALGLSLLAFNSV
jgi:drug/metabolite transporter (DMT)-like permease